MRRTNLLKTIACLAMILVVTGSTIMAGTVSRSQKVRNVSPYINTYSGTVGIYSAAGSSSYAMTNIENKLNGNFWFQATVNRYNYIDNAIDLRKTSTKVLAKGAMMTVSIDRNTSTNLVDYNHIATGCTSSSYSAATRIDNYKFIGMQYYR